MTALHQAFLTEASFTSSLQPTSIPYLVLLQVPAGSTRAVPGVILLLATRHKNLNWGNVENIHKDRKEGHRLGVPRLWCALHLLLTEQPFNEVTQYTRAVKRPVKTKSPPIELACPHSSEERLRVLSNPGIAVTGIHRDTRSSRPTLPTWPVIPAPLGLTFCLKTRLQLEQPLWKPTTKAATRKNQVEKSKEEANPFLSLT